MLWAKLVIPAAMATIGAGAIVAAVVLPAGGADAGASAVWIDGPSGDGALAPGAIPVTAHATADDTITGLDLYVDGEKVTNDKTLARTDKLFYGGFTWDADVGTHELVVRQVGGTGEESAARTIVILEGASPSPTPTTTIPGEPGASTTSAPATTTTTTGPTDTTTTRPPDEPTDTVAPPEGDGTVPQTVPPTSPDRPPTIAAATIVSAYQNRLYAQSCAYTVEVQARISGADYAQVTVEGTGFIETMSRSGESYSLTIGSGSLWGPGDVGSHRVIIEAGGGGASVRKTAGTVTIIQQCPKD